MSIIVITPPPPPPGGRSSSTGSDGKVRIDVPDVGSLADQLRAAADLLDGTQTE